MAMHLGVLLLVALGINVVFALTCELLRHYSRTQGRVNRASFAPDLEAIAVDLELSNKASAFLGRRWDLISNTQLRDWVIWTNDAGTHEANYTVLQRREIGLPFRSFESSITYSVDKTRPSPSNPDYAFLVVRDTTLWPRPRAGLLPNLLIHAALLWLALWFARRVDFAIFRRKYRLARGYCPLCGYDVQRKFDAGCPECGWNRESPLNNDADTCSSTAK